MIYDYKKFLVTNIHSFAGYTALYLFITIFFTQTICLSYNFDTETQKCLNAANSNYGSIYECIYQSKIRYIEQSRNLKTNLALVQPRNTYNLIIQNQLLLDLYIENIENGELKILKETNGIMYQTFAEDILSNVYLTNIQILNLLYGQKLSNKNLTISNVSIKKLEKQIDEILEILKNKLDEKQYQKILNSQQAWKLYRRNTQENILTHVCNIDANNYIKHVILENRIMCLKRTLSALQ